MADGSMSLHRLWRSLTVRALVVLALFVALPVVLYLTFRQADLDRQRLLLESIRVKGLTVGRVLEERLQRADMIPLFRLGEELAKGRSWSEIEATLPGVAEGAYTVDAALALAERYDVEMPIAREVHNALFEGKSVQRCLIDLLSRESKDELQDLG